MNRYTMVMLAVLHPTCAVAESIPDRIVEATGVQGGLVVHLGSQSAKTTAALRVGESYLVAGLVTDGGDVDKMRETLRKGGHCGKVTLDRLVGRRLPYVDNTVNLLVAERLGQVPMAEVMRVLVPGGVALVGRGPKRAKTVKPRPKEIDEWTHFLHGADNNAVAQDTAVESPYHIQWIGEPKYGRSHQFLTSITAMVSAGGRLFYIADEGPTALHEFLPAKWSLTARDAFNGVELWKRPIESWQPFSQKGRIPFPPDLLRRLVAVGDRVYATLDIFGPVTALDAATGKTVRTHAPTDKTEEIVCDGGVLFCVSAVADADSIDRRQAAFSRGKPDRKRIIALRADTGEVLWRKDGADTLGLLPLTLAVRDGRAVFQNTKAIVCLDAKTGRELWRHARKSVYARTAWSTATLVIADGVVLSADRVGRGAGAAAGKSALTRSYAAEFVALSARTGKMMWRCDCAEGHTSPPDVFVAGGLVWVGEVPRHKTLDFRTARDLRTGEVRKKFGPTAGWASWHHHRCYREKATVRYVLAGRTGVEMIDLDTGKLTPHHWIRGSCRYGILPCNGLLYLPPDQCACYIQSRLCGFHALAPRRRSNDPVPPEQPPRLERGPAHGRIRNPQSAIRNRSDWPTLRHDAARSGRTSAAVPLELKQLWRTKLGGKLSAPVSAGGKVYVCQIDTHTVTCLDGDTGKRVWSYTAGGRVDSPPTIAAGIAVFGSRDGYVYALHAADGRLIWRFRAAPDDRRLVAYGQVESVWPVHGSTLVEGDAVYVAAGRNSYVDGGVWLYKLDLATGKTLLAKCHYSREAKTGRRIDLFKPFKGEMLPDRELPGLLPDVLSADKTSLYMRSVALTRKLEPVGLGKAHLFCSMGLLDDASWERTYWLFGTHMYSGARGWHYAKTLEPAGRIMTFDDKWVYGYQDATFTTPGLYAAAKVPKRIKAPVGRARAGRDRRSVKKLRDRKYRAIKFAYEWRNDVPVNVRAMVLAGETLFVAGPPRFDEQKTLAYLRATRTDEAKLPPLLADAVATIEGRKGARLWAVGKADGKKLAELRLDAAPVFDGLIAARGRLYLAALNGQVLCLGAKQD